jgi:hypothetical protein
LQMLHLVMKAQRDEGPGEIEALWEDDAVSDCDRAKAVFWAQHYEKSNIGVWFFQHPRFPMEAVSDLIVSRRMGQGFDDFLFGGQIVNVDLLAAAIQKRVPLFQDEHTLLLKLLKTGGVALADLALCNGYRLSFPTRNTREILEYCPHINCDFIERCRIKGMDTSLILPSLALHSGDLQLLQSCLPGSISDGVGRRLMELAIYCGWAPGLDLIGRRWRPAACTEELRGALCLWGGRKDRERINMEFWDVALELGRAWPDAVFAAAFSLGNLAAMARAIHKGALRRSPSAPHGTWSLNPQRWLRALRFDLRPDALRVWPLWKRTACERRRIYVAALVDQEIAQVVEPDIKQGLKAIYPFLCWWERQARTLAATQRDAPGCDFPTIAGNVLEQPGLDLSTQCGAPNCHLLDFVENVLDHAGLDLPRVWRQAEAVAVVVREWAGLPEPSNNILSLISTSDAASALKGLTAASFEGTKGKE